MTSDYGERRIDLIGTKVIGCQNGVPGVIIEAYDPPKTAQGRGVDVLVRWEGEGLDDSWESGDLDFDFTEEEYREALDFAKRCDNV